MKERKLSTLDKAFMSLMFGAILIGIFIAILDDSPTKKDYEKACIEKLNKIPLLNNCTFVKGDYITNSVIECSCIKDSQMQKYILMGNEVPK